MEPAIMTGIEYGLKNDAVFLVLFLLACGGLSYLVKWVLKTSGERENRLVGIVDKLSSQSTVVLSIDQKIERIGERLDDLINRR